MNPATALARAVLGELVHQGVRDVVLAPGSRSAPLAFEALRLARAGLLRLHVRLDERSAGFLALGLAKCGRMPVAVVCTSGTAVANLCPAVVEASYSALPLVVLSADRPVEARGVGSPQTIDQVRFFGEMVRFFADLGADRSAAAAASPDGQRAARASVGMAVAAALGVPRSGAERLGGSGFAAAMAHSGPVHLNVGFRLPLVPEISAAAAPDLGSVTVSEAVLEPTEEGPASPPRQRLTPFSGCDHREAGAVLGEVPARGIVLVGDLPCTSLRGHHQWLIELATACGWPIIAEPSANVHGAAPALGHGVLVLGCRQFLEQHRPELVVSVGGFGLSRPTMDLLRAAGRHVAIELPTSGREVCDPLRTADRVLTGIPLPPLDPRPDPGWLADWRRADEAAAIAVAEGLARAPGTAAALAATVWREAPDTALLLVAASWPVRQVEAFAGSRTGLKVIGNRGANGIDGLIATAWGAALSHQREGGGPALALLGDLAFLHDHNGLLAAADEPRPDLVIVISDNNGGGIFHQLEQGRPEYADDFERVFGTPQDRDLVAVAEAAGVPAVRVTGGAHVGPALHEAMLLGGVRVVVVDVADRAGEARFLAEMTAQVADRIAEPTGRDVRRPAVDPN